MNDIPLYLAALGGVRSCVILSDGDGLANLVTQLQRIAAIDCVTAFVPPARLDACRAQLAPLGTAVQPLSQAKLVAPAQDMALIYHHITEPQLSGALRCVCGALGSQTDAALALWEHYRTCADHIYLLTEQAHTEALDWERPPGEGNPIELSVIFPMYNVARYLPQCIETAAAWQCDYVEYLFVDDGSPDGCAALIQEAAKARPDFHLLQKPNGGCASARQYGLDRARGRYVAFIDPDDFTAPEMLQKLFRRALLGSYEITYCGYNEYYEDTKTAAPVTADLLGPPYTNGVIAAKDMDQLLTYCRIAIWRGIYLREMLIHSGVRFYTELPRFDDLPFKVETFARARSAVCLPEHLYYYRLARPGQDVSADDERLFVHFEIFKRLDAFLQASANRNHLGCLQIIKVQTHHWTLRKLRPEFVAGYCAKAKQDLRKNLTFWQSCQIVRRGVNRADFAYFLALYFGWTPVVKWMKKNQKRKV